MPTIFITGIDTGIGKTVATGLLARYLARSGYSVITQKLVQTGCEGLSEDIRVHRQLMGVELRPVDLERITCPFVFPFPASPHLAARHKNRVIMPERIVRATKQLEDEYEYVLIEGAGGIYVPLNDAVTVIDYLLQNRYPLILVSSSRLGSINQTLLTLEAAKSRQLDVLGVVYNCYPPENPLITKDSKHIFAAFLKRFGYKDAIVPLPRIDLHGKIPNIDFSPIL